MNHKNRLRRSMMFLNAQKPNLLKDPYIYGADSLIFDLEDAVALGEKDAARFTLFHALKKVDYQNAEKVVRINGIDTPFWKEDIRCVVFAGWDRLFGVALSAGDYTKDLHTGISGSGVELSGARQLMIIHARAAGIQCFDTVYTNLEDMEGFRKEVELIHTMGFDGKTIINPRQIPVVHAVYTPSAEEITFAEKVVQEIDEKRSQGIGVFTVDGKMIDIAFYDGAKRTLALAKAAGALEEVQND